MTQPLEETFVCYLERGLVSHPEYIKEHLIESIQYVSTFTDCRSVKVIVQEIPVDNAKC